MTIRRIARYQNTVYWELDRESEKKEKKVDRLKFDGLFKSHTGVKVA